METEKVFSRGQLITIFGGIISIISVFLPWFSATSDASSLSINGIFSIDGSGMLLRVVGENANWEFQGIGVLALGIAGIAVAIILKDRMQSIGTAVCGILIIGGGAVNLYSLRDIGLFSGSVLGETVQSGIGYGLYAVMIGGAVVASGGLLGLMDKNN